MIRRQLKIHLVLKTAKINQMTGLSSSAQQFSPRGSYFLAKVLCTIHFEVREGVQTKKRIKYRKLISSTFF